MNQWKELLKEKYGTQSVVITDTTDDNARGRVETRIKRVIGSAPTFVGVTYPNQLEAAGALVDQLDALEDSDALVLVNVAPRSVNGENAGNRTENSNGTPFCWFRHNKVLVVASLDGYTLSLAKKLRLMSEVRVINFPVAIGTLLKAELISECEAESTLHTQFRSYEILPKFGAYLLAEYELPHTVRSADSILDAPSAVWLADAHGNCKTTLLAEEIEGLTRVTTRWGTFPVYARLKDVPDGVTAVITGSSGIGAKRFVEIIIQGGNATEKLNIKTLYGIRS